MKIHEFTSTRAAYGACQCNADVKSGDVLVIESEQVVGVADTWPVAVTANYGELHQLHPQTCAQCWAELAGKPALLEGWNTASQKAAELGYPLWKGES